MADEFETDKTIKVPIKTFWLLLEIIGVIVIGGASGTFGSHWLGDSDGVNLAPIKAQVNANHAQVVANDKAIALLSNRVDDCRGAHQQQAAQIQWLERSCFRECKP